MFNEKFFLAFKDILPDFFSLVSSLVIIWLYLNELEKEIDETIKKLEEK